MEHAILSTSAAHRWLKCTPSARLEQNAKDKTSSYAQEGKKAHALAEHWLQYELGLRPDAPQGEPEMMSYVKIYVDTVLDRVTPDSMVMLERRLDFSSWVPQGFGTGDAVIVNDRRLEIVDLKYGRGVPVSAENNPQLRLYALGALYEFTLLYDFTIVRMTIVQPRLDIISTEELTTSELLEWGESIEPIAQKAFAGEGELNPGDHCRFCKVRPTCTAANLRQAILDFQQND